MNFKSKLVVLIIGSVITSVGILLFQSCQRDKDNIDYKLKISDEYNQVGKLHNEGLDFVFNAIKDAHLENMKNAGSNLKSAQVLDYETIVTDATLQFCKENKSLKASFNVYQAAIVKSHSNLKSTKLGANTLDEFNPKQKELLNEIFAALKVKYSKQNLEKLKEDLAKINSKASAELSATEAAPIYCATSTAYATYQYWQRNYKKWYFALHYPEILKQYNDAQLNNLSLKNGTLRLKSGTWEWWTHTWNSVEEWWEETTDSFSDWWNNYGESVMIADGVGAASGCGKAIVKVGAESLVFGPEGIVVTAVGGAVCGAIEASARGIIGCEIYDLIH
jgi:hypothetical protein